MGIFIIICLVQRSTVCLSNAGPLIITEGPTGVFVVDNPVETSVFFRLFEPILIALTYNIRLCMDILIQITISGNKIFC